MMVFSLKTTTTVVTFITQEQQAWGKLSKIVAQAEPLSQTLEQNASKAYKGMCATQNSERCNSYIQVRMIKRDLLCALAAILCTRIYWYLKFLQSSSYSFVVGFEAVVYGKAGYAGQTTLHHVAATQTLGIIKQLVHVLYGGPVGRFIHLRTGGEGTGTSVCSVVCMHLCINPSTQSLKVELNLQLVCVAKCISIHTGYSIYMYLLTELNPIAE